MSLLVVFCYMFRLIEPSSGNTYRQQSLKLSNCIEYEHSVTCCRKPEYENEDIRPSLVNGFAKRVPAATKGSVAGQRLAGLDVFQR
jgi:hypothetical protein